MKLMANSCRCQRVRQQNGTIIYRAKAETKMEEKEGWREGKRMENVERRRRMERGETEAGERERER